MAQFPGEINMVSLRLRDETGRRCMKAPRAGGGGIAFRADALTCPYCGAAAARRSNQDSISTQCQATTEGESCCYALQVAGAWESSLGGGVPPSSYLRH